MRAVREHMPTVRLTGHDADPEVRAIADRLGLCDACGRPLERQANGEWTASEPLDRPKQAA